MRNQKALLSNFSIESDDKYVTETKKKKVIFIKNP